MNFRKKRECKWNSVPIHEQARLDNRIRPVFFTFSVFFTAVLLLDFEVIIRAVIVQDLIVSFAKKVAVLIQLCLDQVAFGAKNI